MRTQIINISATIHTYTFHKRRKKRPALQIRAKSMVTHAGHVHDSIPSLSVLRSSDVERIVPIKIEHPSISRSRSQANGSTAFASRLSLFFKFARQWVVTVFTGESDRYLLGCSSFSTNGRNKVLYTSVITSKAIRHGRLG